MRKNLLLAAMIAALAFAGVACSDDDTVNEDDEATEIEETEATDEMTDEATEEATEEATS